MLEQEVVVLEQEVVGVHILLLRDGDHGVHVLLRVHGGSLLDMVLRLLVGSNSLDVQLHLNSETPQPKSGL